ncbi:anhydro-N-acetylmuramic acid kinase [Carboxylicivirga sp. M1479]|uniref:anhydro-N-acetylmuramic acid kinase n=1 Tax=Carboxylicivirga sp. M1479 TaxID=2594476 RepID=UPI001177A495|nr:anhydro-N-acetylmuramic acid kinase [Carboxylicivirga sp. M1479]TRX63545.1 anhydro-N-acetylmuramic acid kinase [Carboxylicivirga sp. M1479]
MKQIKNSYCCVGAMSGTSLDGLDLLVCELTYTQKKWSYTFIKCCTIAYSKTWLERLKTAPSLSGRALLLLHRQYGTWMGEAINSFLQDESIKPDLIASHGHTVFHEPDLNLNFQVGDGNMVAAQTGIQTVSDFRSLDVCLNGQGAPLVPVGDAHLFSNYSACVNIGGFANVSCQENDKRIAWDMCPVNYVVNRLVADKGLQMDKGGEVGRKGVVLPQLLQELNDLSYYQLDAPKTLSQEWVDKYFWKLIHASSHHALEDIIRTCYEHFSIVISHDLNNLVPDGSVLFTGGGVKNTFLIQLIAEKYTGNVSVPNEQLIDYKEALVFALLGVLRLRSEVNCWQSVTGADTDSCSGVINSGK